MRRSGSARKAQGLLIAGVAILSSLLMARGARADGDHHDDGNKATVIVSATVDFTAGQITILGKHFPSRPLVRLDGTPLTIISHGRTEILASLQAVAGLEQQPGDYRLTISRDSEEGDGQGEGEGGVATFVATIGAVGPAGAPGPRGPKGDKGDTGPQGPPGVFSGHFQSPNGLYALDVTDSGIVLRSPGARIEIVGNNANIKADNVTVDANLNASVTAGIQVKVHGLMGELSSDSTTVVKGPMVTIN